MDKTTFRYQKWLARMMSLGAFFWIVRYFVSDMAEKLLGPEHLNFWQKCICSFIVIIGATVYYFCTENSRLFIRQGSYWVENGIVYLQMKKKIYALNNVTEISGYKISFFGLAGSGRLSIHMAKKRILIISPTIIRGNKFSDSELLPLFDTILSHNTALKKNDTLDFWYEIEGK